MLASIYCEFSDEDTVRSYAVHKLLQQKTKLKFGDIYIYMRVLFGN